MTVFYQHIGEQLWQRDAPKSIGAPNAGVKRFSFNDVEEDLDHLDLFELSLLRSTIFELAPTGFQIWGIPEGAQRVIANMGAGDFLILQESTEFKYVGQVLHKVSQPCWELSRRIWGEQRFPLIVFMQGELIPFPWSDFREQFGFDPKYHMRGNTMRLAPERLADSSFGSEEKFVSHLLTTAGTQPFDMERDFSAFANNLEVHFRKVKARASQQDFRRKVLNQQGNQCSVCDIAFPEVLDAAHIVPKENSGSDDHRNGIALCSLHHRMYDSNMFDINPSTLKIVPNNDYTTASLRITRETLEHLENKPHRHALDWRWSKRVQSSKPS